MTDGFCIMQLEIRLPSMTSQRSIMAVIRRFPLRTVMRNPMNGTTHFYNRCRPVQLGERIQCGSLNTAPTDPFMERNHCHSKPLKTDFVRAANHPRASNAAGFTLLELLVVLGVIAMLIAVQVPVLAGGKSQSKIAICASHVRQLALSCQIYANENGDRLPILIGSAAWAWDMPASAANALLHYGAQTN